MKHAVTITKSKRQFCTFWLSNRLFGVDILHVKEITSELEFTPVFHAPSEVKGYVNIRGQIHLVIDLRLLLGFENKDIMKTSKVILFKPEVGESFGMLVDRIGDVLEISEDEMERERSKDQNELEESEKSRGMYLKEGVCKLKDQLLIILSAKNLLTSIKCL